MVDPATFGRDADDTTLRVAWWPDGFEIVFHYSESRGFDCGFHREANSHVSGKTHYQERANAEGEYDYEAVSFRTQVPTRLCWAVLERLKDRLE